MRVAHYQSLKVTNYTHPRTYLKNKFASNKYWEKNVQPWLSMFAQNYDNLLYFQAGLDHFCEQDVLIRPTCTYVQKVLKENLTSRYKDHVEESYLKSLL